MIKKIIGGLAAVMMTAAVCIGATVAGQGYKMYQAALEETSLEEMAAAIQEKEGYTTLEELPETYVNAVVSVEDHRFYNHFGLDMIAICRAIVNDIKAGAYVEGGSTITQQLAKNLYFSQEKKMERKAAEVFMALALEDQFSKDEILELYVNSIYFGDGYYTAGDASRGYFDKEPSEMTEYESTLLAGIPNAPSKYAPTKNPQLAAKRQKQVLRRLEACGYLVGEETKLLASVNAGDRPVRMAEIVNLEQKKTTLPETGFLQSVASYTKQEPSMQIADILAKDGRSVKYKKGKGKTWLRRVAKPGDSEKETDADYLAASVFLCNRKLLCNVPITQKRSALDAHSALRENGCLCNRASAREFTLANSFYV